MDIVLKFFLVAPVLLFSMVAHEYAHGWAALKQGDNTALMLGRLTWNPLKHIDPVMTVLMPILTFAGSGGTFAFGGAKPVPVNPSQYRSPVRGDIIVSLAGIVTNLLLAALFVPAVAILGLLARGVPAIAGAIWFVQVMLLVGITLNLVLAMFNLMPIPPLDGSHVLKHLLPASVAPQYARLQRWGFPILVVMLWIGQPVLRWWMSPAFALNSWAFDLLDPLIVRGHGVGL